MVSAASAEAPTERRRKGPYTYDAYGNGAAATGFPFKYTGRRLDPETGLYYYRARVYSSALGRFLQTDPIGYQDQMNAYAYVGNDPLNATDPSGQCMVCAGAIVGAVVGVLVQAAGDVATGNVSSVGSYARAFVGGAAGGAAAVVCGATCAGEVASAASSATRQMVDNGNIDVAEVASDAAFGGLISGGAALVATPIVKHFVSNSFKGKVGEFLSEVGLRSSGSKIIQKHVKTGYGDSSIDFLVEKNSFLRLVESKFGTSKPKGKQLQSIDELGADVHEWTYHRVNGIAKSGINSAAERPTK